MYYVGIDLSLNSTGMVICKNNNYEFFSFVNGDFDKEFKNKHGRVLSEFKTHKEISQFVNVFNYTRYLNVEDYQISEYNKIYDADKVTDLIVSKIPDNSIIAIEGFSYASKSRSFIDIISYASVLRYKIFKKFKKLLVFSPSEIKKFATGKGNADKFKMFDAILNENIQHPYFEYLENNADSLVTKTKIKKPIDDINDAYFVCQLLKNYTKI